MKTTSNLILAAATVLSLGFGTAMAQEGPSMLSASDIALQRQQAAPKIINEGAGSSDTGAVVHYDYSTLANPG